MLADGAGAVLDRRAVRAGAGGDRTRRRRVVLAISEHREQFPGVAVRRSALPLYPHGVARRAPARLHRPRSPRRTRSATRRSTDADTIGVSGLEEQYDAVAARDRRQAVVQLNPQGYTVGTGGVGRRRSRATRWSPASTRDVQKLAETVARRSRSPTRRKAGKPATGGAVVVMDPHTGRILAVGQLPDLRPDAVRRRHLDGRLRSADRADGRRPAARPGDRRRSTRRARRSS